MTINDVTRVETPQREIDLNTIYELTLDDIEPLTAFEALDFLRKYQRRHNYRMMAAFFASERSRVRPGDVFSAVADVHPETGRIRGIVRTPAVAPQAGAVLEFQADRFGLIASGMDHWGVDHDVAAWYETGAMSVQMPTETILTYSAAYMAAPLARAI